jgi:hypothetical protein
VSYLAVKDIQSWLQQSKYAISSVDSGFETAAVAYVFGEIQQRYDTSSWVNATTTPDLVLIALAMQVASYELRRAAGEEDGRTTYADFLDQRACKLVDSIVTGAVVLEGATVSTGSLGQGPAFFPDNGAELRDPSDPTFAPAYFSMSQIF